VVAAKNLFGCNMLWSTRLKQVTRGRMLRVTGLVVLTDYVVLHSMKNNSSLFSLLCYSSCALNLLVCSWFNLICGNIVAGFARNALLLHSEVGIKSVQRVARSLYLSVLYDQIPTLMP